MTFVFYFDSWGVFFSHPADFTPVCTTELGAVAKLVPEFEKRKAKVIAISCDPVDSHKKWIEDIKVSQQSVNNATNKPYSFPTGIQQG